MFTFNVHLNCDQPGCLTELDLFVRDHEVRDFEKIKDRARVRGWLFGADAAMCPACARKVIWTIMHSSVMP